MNSTKQTTTTTTITETVAGRTKMTTTTATISDTHQEPAMPRNYDGRERMETLRNLLKTNPKVYLDGGEGWVHVAEPYYTRRSRSGQPFCEFGTAVDSDLGEEQGKIRLKIPRNHPCLKPREDIKASASRNQWKPIGRQWEPPIDWDAMKIYLFICNDVLDI